jgi:hypothetical protein
LHGRVIDNYGELVGRDVVAAPDDEVSQIAAGDEELRTEVEVGEVDFFAVGDAEAPVWGGWGIGVRDSVELSAVGMGSAELRLRRTGEATVTP